MCVTYIDFSRFKACFGAGKVEIGIIEIKTSYGVKYITEMSYYEKARRLPP